MPMADITVIATAIGSLVVAVGSLLVSVDAIYRVMRTGNPIKSSASD